MQLFVNAPFDLTFVAQSNLAWHKQLVLSRDINSDRNSRFKMTIHSSYLEEVATLPFIVDLANGCEHTGGINAKRWAVHFTVSGNFKVISHHMYPGLGPQPVPLVLLC